MIHLQVHLQIPCYDFLLFQMVGFTYFSVHYWTVQKVHQTIRYYKRRAVCTNGRDIINAS
jgi:hypothetical protein